MKILHVPRTGGTAIKASLVKGYRKHPKDIKYLSTRIPKLYICNHKQVLDSRDQYIIFVRDPIERFISHFVFLKKHAAGYDTEKYMNPSTDKVIGKYDNINDFAKDIFKFKLRKFIRFSDILISPEYVKRHEKNIKFVGRTEYLNQDFLQMQKVLKTFTKIEISKKYTNKRPDRYDELTKLDKISFKNLRKYLSKDYMIIKTLSELGFLDRQYLKEIHL
jgi:hypothetical protein